MLSGPFDRALVTSAFNGNVQTFNPQNTVQAGSSAVLLAYTGGNVDNRLVSVSDTKGSRWAVDFTFAQGGGPYFNAASAQNLPQSITPSDTVTLNWNQLGNFARGIWIEEVGGLLAPAFDQAVGGNGSGTSTAVSVGPTGTLASSYEIAFFALLTADPNAFLSMPGWTPFTNNPAPGSYYAFYRVLGSNAPLTATGTLSRNTVGPWFAELVTYRLLPQVQSTAAQGGLGRMHM